MAHIRQEFRLGDISRFGRVARRDQFFLGLLLPTHVPGYLDKALERSALVVHGRDHTAGIEAVAIFPHVPPLVDRFAR